MITTNAEFSLITNQTIESEVDTQVTIVIPVVLNSAGLGEPVSDNLIGLLILNLLCVSDDLLSNCSDKYFNGHCF